MSNRMQYFPGEEKETSTTTRDSENVQISLPKNDRPEGPFEHSGETAGWTPAEEAETKENAQQPEEKSQGD